ncbi:hypothetical protein NS354_12185 [Leucobacter chromiiresistens]|uniref:Uncharacterized protein n=2 Tax=Leucobacter chromiiresistens TaxID=1079994 RepID=A0A147EC61_9MICO|nr:hypothetical protein NS354_12185 [Leucobacter chromiiresistens]
MQHATRYRLGQILLVAAVLAFAWATAVSLRVTHGYSAAGLAWMVASSLIALAFATAGTWLLSDHVRQALTISIGIALFVAPTAFGAHALLSAYIVEADGADIGAWFMMLCGNILLPAGGALVITASIAFAVQRRRRLRRLVSVCEGGAS